jgi:hypothetical protein
VARSTSYNMLPFECLNYNTPGHIVALATFRPTECLIGPASYLTRAAGDGMGAARGTSGPPRLLGRGTVVLQSPRSRYFNSLSAGPGCASIASRWRDANESQSGFVNIRVRPATPSGGQAASACESACSYFALEAAPIGDGRASLMKLGPRSE